MKKSFSFFIENKRIRALISVCFAIIIWLAVSIGDNASGTRAIGGISVYVNIEDTIVSTLGLDIVDDAIYDQKVSVQISGPSNTISAITPQDILVTPSFEEIRSAGTYDLKLTAIKNSNQSGYSIESVHPQTVTVTFDYIDTKTFPVEIKTIGASAAQGLTLGTPTFSSGDSGNIVIRGSRTEMEKINKVVAEAEVDQVLEVTGSFDATIKLLNADGEELSLDNYALGYTKTKISLPIYISKTVPVTPAYSNLPEGFAPSAQVIVDGKSITQIVIEGPPETVSEVTGVSLVPIDMYEVSPTNNTFEVDFVLPNGVQIEEKFTNATVKINTSGYSTKEFTVSRVLAVKADKLNVTLSKPLQVTLCGPSSDLNRLSSDDLYMEINLDGKGEGEQSVSAKIKANTGYFVWQNGKYDAVVNVTKKQ